MSSVLLDTSAYSGLIRGNLEILEELQLHERICLTPVVLAELYSGFIAGRHERRNRKILAEFMEADRVTVLDIGPVTAERYAVIYRHLKLNGTPVPVNDIWIAASAMEHGLKVLTCDEHFSRIPQVIATCFAPGTG